MKTTIIGVGRRGGDIVSGLSSCISSAVLFADTDKDDLAKRPNSARLHIGARIPEEEPIKNDPIFSFNAALESRASIESRVDGSDLAVLIAGLGGGAGTGGTKALAKICSEMGLKVIALVTRPFGMEGEARVWRGRMCQKELSRQADLTVAFHQDSLLSLVGQATRVREVVAVANEIIGYSARALVSFIDESDLSQLDDLLRERSQPGLFGYGVSAREGGVLEAVRFACDSPFLQGVNLNQTTALAVSLFSRQPLEAADIARALDELRERTSQPAKILHKQWTKPSLEHEVELHAHLMGDFGDPLIHVPDIWVPGPSG